MEVNPYRKRKVSKKETKVKSHCVVSFYGEHFQGKEFIK